MAIYIGPTKLTGGESVGVNPNFVTNSNYQIWLPDCTTTGTIESNHTSVCNCWYSYQSSTNGVRVTRKNNTSGITVQRLSGEYAGIQQTIQLSTDLSAKTFCFSVYVDNQINYLIYKQGTVVYGASNDPNTNLTLSITDTSMTIRIYFTNSSVHILDWAKVELGSVLTPYFPKLYADELIICSMYDAEGNVSLPSASHALTANTATLAETANNSLLFNGQADTSFVKCAGSTMSGNLTLADSACVQLTNQPNYNATTYTGLMLGVDDTTSKAYLDYFNNGTKISSLLFSNTGSIYETVNDTDYKLINYNDVADATHNGLISTESQTFAGTKTFSNGVNISGNVTLNGNNYVWGKVYISGSSVLSNVSVINLISGSVSTPGTVQVGSSSIATNVTGSTITLGTNTSTHTRITGNCYFANGTTYYVNTSGVAKLSSINASNGTFTGTLSTSGGTWSTPQCRNIQVGTVDLTDGVSTLAFGQLYCYVES